MADDGQMRKQAYLLLTLTSIIWGSNFILGKYLAGTLPPFTMAAGRFGLAGLIYIPLVLRRRSEERPKRRNYPALLVSGLTGVFGFNTLLYLGLHYTSSTNSTLTNAFSPLLITLLAGVWLRERITWKQVAGVLISFLGVAVVQTRGSWVILRALEFNPGDLIILANTLLWAVYSVLTRIVTRDVSPLMAVAYTTWFGLLFLLPASLWELFRTPVHFTIYAGAALLYLGVFASVLGFLWWNRSIALAGPLLAGNFYNLIPVWAVAMAVIFLGETVRVYHWAGGILVVGGIILASRSSRQGLAVPAAPAKKELF